jgi:hypothetical protein
MPYIIRRAAERTPQFGKVIKTKKGKIYIWEYNETVHQLFVDFKKAYDSVRRKVLYNILSHGVFCVMHADML